MIIINAFFVLIWCISVNTHYTLYYSDIHQSSYPIFDCLYAYLIDAGKEIGKRYIQNYHLIPYCQRPDYNDNNEEENPIIYPIDENIAQTLSFKELKEQNITSEQLLKWFSPIDIAEKYEMNLNDSDVFHNCSSPWFGSLCQYKFDCNLSLSFDDIIHSTFSNPMDNISNGICYRFLSGCNNELWPMCLDWREICDGKIDCLNGKDEEWCDQLEMNECNDNEYRCHYGGQCIPLSFLKDNRLSIDCLDGSDEIEMKYYWTLVMNEHCASVSTFRCQERISRYPRSFICDDRRYLTIPNTQLVELYCSDNREKEYSRFKLTSLDHISDMICRQTFNCALHNNRTSPTEFDNNDVWKNNCESLSKHCSSKWLLIPAQPILFGFFQFGYFTNRSVDEFKINIAPDFVCFHGQRCPTLLRDLISIKIIDGLTCYSVFNLIETHTIKDFDELEKYFFNLSERCLKSGIDKSCLNSSYFHCEKSLKCIRYDRVGDGRIDCFYHEDELFDACQLNQSNRFMCTSKPNKCLMTVAIGNGYFDCNTPEDELFAYTNNLLELIPFSFLCNGNNDYLEFLHMSNHTDESNCDLWPCDNPYTHCNGEWNCQNGIDELNCPDSRCSLNEYECKVKYSSLVYCISKSYIYEKYFSNCTSSFRLSRDLYFYNETNNINNDDYYSWNTSKCITYDKLCRNQYSLQISRDVCLYQPELSNIRNIGELKLIQNQQYLCHLKPQKKLSVNEGIMPPSVPFFKASRFGYFPSISTNLSMEFISKINEKIQCNIDSSYCHRGILIRIGRNQTKKCLCPPNYFGHRCQWQNQRISLTIQLVWRSTETSIVIFQLIIMLIDQYGQIAPYNEEIIYMPNRDCNTKYNIYLLYPDRPKSLLNKYSIRIDLYEKIKLNYWTSWLIKIPFQFLPVNRIVTQLIIPEIDDQHFCNLSCGEHGKCRNYLNNKFLFFCQCNQGYFGSYCQHKHLCHCSNDSFCFNSSICICPLYKFGRYCHLKHSICQLLNNPCQHNGICVPNDNRINLTGFSCFCPDDYSGEICQNKNNQIDIQLDQTIISNNSLLLLHFITSFQNAEHERTTMLKKIPYSDQNLTVYITQSFNILFIEIPNQDYYLTVVRERFIPSEYIYTKISSKQRCLSIVEINKSLFDYEYLQRVKFYPLLCRKYSKLMCFYDIDLMCICDMDRFSNCFLFNHTMNNDCQGYNYCQNNGQCFQNNETCPTKFSCICQNCFYGSKCQFSTKGFIFSLDSILGYHIKPNLSINHQSLIIKISLTIITIMFIIGIINGLLSIITFRRKIPRQVGSGNYLLISSIVSWIMIIFLTIKFSHLMLSQMSLIQNRDILLFNCIILDVTIKILLSSNEWLNSCVAIERMISVIKGVPFQKRKSQKISKWIIIIVFIVTIITHIHDPLHRQLIDDIDIDERRIWCFVRYSFSIEIYNSFITLFHFLVPFLINVLSALLIIRKISHNRATVRPEQPFQQHLQYQIQQHRQLLFGPCLLIFLFIPRLLISFVNGCMRSAHEPWLYLFGYYLSFIPSMLTFVLFVLPSKFYKKEFQMGIEEIMKNFRRN